MKQISYIIILFILNYIALNFITNNINNNIKEVASIYAIGILFGILSIASHFILDKLFTKENYND